MILILRRSITELVSVDYIERHFCLLFIQRVKSFLPTIPPVIRRGMMILFFTQPLKEKSVQNKRFRHFQQPEKLLFGFPERLMEK
jgi:hypothetical protein